jgi:hypothetical protein
VDQGGLVVDDVECPAGRRVLDGGQDGGGHVVGVMKENSEAPSPISGSLPACSRRVRPPPSGSKLEPGP